MRYDSKIVTELAKVYVGDVFVAAGQSNMELNYAQYYEGNNNAYNFGKGLVKKTDLPKPLVDKNVKFVIADHDAKNTDFPLANVNLNAGAWLNADSTNSLRLSYLTQQCARSILTYQSASSRPRGAARLFAGIYVAEISTRTILHR